MDLNLNSSADHYLYLTENDQCIYKKYTFIEKYMHFLKRSSKFLACFNLYQVYFASKLVI